jgi:hypothetical protein
MYDSEDLTSFCLVMSGVSRNSRTPPRNSHNGAAPLRNHPEISEVIRG